MAVEAGHLVDKQSFVDRFNGHVRNWLQAQIVWHDGNVPADFPAGKLGPAHLPVPTPTELIEDIDQWEDGTPKQGGEIDAGALVNLFRTYCQQYARVRKVRFRKRGNISNNIVYDQTQVAALVSSYSGGLTINTPGDVDGDGDLVAAGSWNNWMEQLRQLLEANMNSVLEDDSFITVVAEPPPPPVDGGRGRR